MQIREIRIIIRMLDPDRNPDHPPNLTDSSLTRDTPLVKVSCKSVRNLISNPRGGQTEIDRQTDKQTNYPQTLKGLAQAKIIKKSVILFWLPYMTIWCKHVHRLELQQFFNFSSAHSPVRLDIETKFLISNYWQPCQKIEIREFRLYI